MVCRNIKHAFLCLSCFMHILSVPLHNWNQLEWCYCQRKNDVQPHFNHSTEAKVRIQYIEARKCRWKKELWKSRLCSISMTAVIELSSYILKGKQCRHKKFWRFSLNLFYYRFEIKLYIKDNPTLVLLIIV
jgi:hypothetical protein